MMAYDMLTVRRRWLNVVNHNKPTRQNRIAHLLPVGHLIKKITPQLTPFLTPDLTPELTPDLIHFIKWPSVYTTLLYTVNHKKCDILFLTITLANLNLFL